MSVLCKSFPVPAYQDNYVYDCVRYKAALSMQMVCSGSQHPLQRHAERREERAGIKEDVIERTVSDRCEAASQCSGD